MQRVNVARPACWILATILLRMPFGEDRPRSPPGPRSAITRDCRSQSGAQLRFTARGWHEHCTLVHPAGGSPTILSGGTLSKRGHKGERGAWGESLGRGSRRDPAANWSAMLSLLFASTRSISPTERDSLRISFLFRIFELSPFAAVGPTDPPSPPNPGAGVFASADESRGKASPVPAFGRRATPWSFASRDRRGLPITGMSGQVRAQRASGSCALCRKPFD